MSAKQDLSVRRKARLRYQIRHKSHGRPRLSVFRSGKNIYAQVIDDSQGRTVASASTLDKTLKADLKGSNEVPPNSSAGSRVDTRWARFL